VSAAIHAAVQAAGKQLSELARADAGSPLNGAAANEISFENGRLFNKDDPQKSESFSALLARNGREKLEATADAKPGDENKKYAMHAFGAHFCEVRVDPELATVRIVRWVAAHACGRVLNAKTTNSQIMGGAIMGIGMALMEETRIDKRWGRILTEDLANYHVPVHADIPDFDSLLIDEVDPVSTVLGTKGIGEIGITGAAAAVANAVFHATGRRIRDLPITPDKLLV
jgi:xanthine dehydrogenase YagR molybdenum-binding subunit